MPYSVLSHSCRVPPTPTATLRLPKHGTNQHPHTRLRQGRGSNQCRIPPQRAVETLSPTCNPAMSCSSSGRASSVRSATSSHHVVVEADQKCVPSPWILVIVSGISWPTDASSAHVGPSHPVSHRLVACVPSSLTNARDTPYRAQGGSLGLQGQGGQGG